MDSFISLKESSRSRVISIFFPWRKIRLQMTEHRRKQADFHLVRGVHINLESEFSTHQSRIRSVCVAGPGPSHPSLQCSSLDLEASQGSKQESL